MKRPKHPARPWYLLLAAGIVLFPLFTDDVYGCQCRERQPPCAQYSSADAVFVGAVTKIKPTAKNLQQIISFTVERGLVGVNSSNAELVNDMHSCRYDFKEGEKYLVYAYRNWNSPGNELYTHYCTRTRELSNAVVDLAYIKTLSEKGPQLQILGVLADGDKRLRKVRVSASSAGRHYRSFSDNDGWFKFMVPRPGRYRVSILLPPYSDVVGTKEELDQISNRVRTRAHTLLEYDVAVAPGKCAFVNPPLFVDYLEYEKQRKPRHARLPNKTLRLTPR
jgi:hypothetical protein